jgi:hypothetical protein
MVERGPKSNHEETRTLRFWIEQNSERRERCFGGCVSSDSTDENAVHPGSGLHLKPTWEPRKHEGHETDGCEGTMLRFILFRAFVAFNIGFGGCTDP